MAPYLFWATTRSLKELIKIGVAFFNRERERVRHFSIERGREGEREAFFNRERERGREGEKERGREGDTLT